MTEKKIGILTFAFGPSYQLQAYCQALTARFVLGLETTVVVGSGDEVDSRLSKVANVVSLSGAFSRFEYEKHALDVTPYDITFKTDADLLFPAGSYLYHADGLPATSGVACDVRGAVADTTFYRRVESNLGLPTIYSACFSFDKNHPKCTEYFDQIKRLFKEWYRLKVWATAGETLLPTTDSVYSLAWSKVFGTSRIEGNHFIHAKSKINDWTNDDWTTNSVLMLDRGCRMYMDGVRLTHPFHYYDKNLINQEFITRLENVCGVREAGSTGVKSRRNSGDRRTNQDSVTV